MPQIGWDTLKKSLSAYVVFWIPDPPTGSTSGAAGIVINRNDDTLSQK
jgi:hypothetical protein